MSNSPAIISPITLLAASSTKGMAQPPWVNPLLGSSPGPPGACMTPSRVTCVIAIIFLIGLLHFSQARRSRTFLSIQATPTVAAENSVRVLPWHSPHLASEFRNKPHRRHHHPLSERPQLILAAVVEHSAIEQTRGAIRAPLKVDRSQSDKSQDCLALLPRWWRPRRPRCVT